MTGQPARRRSCTSKVKRACDTCRTRKIKCDEQDPCASCVRHGFSCTYIPVNGVQSRSEKRRHSKPHQSRPATLPVDPQSSAPIVNTANTSRKQVLPKDSNTVDLEDQDDLNEINAHTEGTEFHGASGAWAFLSKLRSKAREAQRQTDNVLAAPPGSPTFSIVSYLHNPGHLNPEANDCSRETPEPSAPAWQPNLSLEKAAVQLYFDGLHIVHPFLDKDSFQHRCEREVWNLSSRVSTTAQAHFHALYNMVLAVGLITANEDSAMLRQVRLCAGSSPGRLENAVLSPVQCAELYFRRAKTQLGDVFHASSIDATAALFLLSVYCQNALRPHSCYLYSGMAVRTALAVGIASKASTRVPWSGQLWWALYSHELEMCSSVGRSTALASPQAYIVPVPEGNQNAPAGLIECMVRFADIHRRISETSYPSIASDSRTSRSTLAMEIESELRLWKGSLAPTLDYDQSSFTDPEWRLKQKLVLQLRLSNARILLHRPFFSSTGALNSKSALIDHVRPCVDASISTIDVLYSAYTNRPWFRSWWYNTTYLLYAEMVILYILLSDIEVLPETSLYDKAQQGLSILDSMKSNMVARNCATVVREVLSIITELSASRRSRRHAMQPATSNPETRELRPSPYQAIPFNDQQEQPLGDIGLVEDCEDLFCNLADSSFLDDLLHTDLWHLDPI